MMNYLSGASTYAMVLIGASVVVDSIFGRGTHGGSIFLIVAWSFVLIGLSTIYEYGKDLAYYKERCRELEVRLGWRKSK